MQMGYLSPHGHMIAVDTFFVRTLFGAFRLERDWRNLHHLSASISMVPLADVQFEVTLHRGGWTKAGDVVLRKTAGQLYEAGEYFLLIGPRWRSLRIPRVGGFTPVVHPFMVTMKPIEKKRGFTRPSRKAPSIVLFRSDDVVDGRADGATVKLRAIEYRQFTDFLLGKLTATIEFPSAGSAKAFSDRFRRSKPPVDLDRSITPDVSRSKRVRWNRRAISRTALYFGFWPVLAWALVYSIQNQGILGNVGAVVVTIAYSRIGIWSVPTLLRARREEDLDLAEAWPRIVYERWSSEIDERATSFLQRLKSLGVDIEAEASLKPLEDFLRSLLPRTFYGGFALDAAALVTRRFLRSLDPGLRHTWPYDKKRYEMGTWRGAATGS